MKFIESDYAEGPCRWIFNELAAAIREAWAYIENEKKCSANWYNRFTEEQCRRVNLEGERDAKQDTLDMTIEICSAEILKLRKERDAAYARAIDDAARVAEEVADKTLIRMAEMGRANINFDAGGFGAIVNTSRNIAAAIRKLKETNNEL